MFSFLVKLVIRFILKNNRIFIINVTGLGLVFAVTVFIGSWVRYEESYDRSYENSNRLYRISFEYTDGEASRDFARVNFEPWISNFYGYFPEVESILRISGSIARLSPSQSLSVKCGDTKFDAKQAFETDSNFFHAFNVKLLEGNSSDVLKEPKSAVLSKSFAETYYPGINPLGKPLLIYRNDTSIMQYTITGIMPDFPPNSHLHPQYLVSFDNPQNFSSIFYLYFLLKEKASAEDLKKKFESFGKKYLTSEQQKGIKFHLQPVTDIHLHSSKLLEIETNGNAELVFSLKIAGLLLLIIVFVNYVNMQLAAFQNRHKYILINNTLGSRKRAIAYLLIIEGLITSFVSVFIGVFLLALFSDKLKGWLQIVSPISESFGLHYYLFFTAAFILVGVLCSLYPMFLLRNNLPVKSMESHSKSTFVFGRKEGKVRTGLVLAQFTVAIAMIIATLFISKQISYSLKNRLGKNQDNILTIGNLPREITSNFRNFKQELIKRPVIKDMTFHWYLPGKDPFACSNFTIDNKAPENKKIYMLPVSHNFNTFYGIRFLAGDDFTETEPGQYIPKYIINETALHYLGFTKPSEAIGKPFQYFYFETGWIKQGYIIGVVEDTYIASLEINEKPLVMIYKDDFFLSSLSVKYAEGKMDEAVSAVKDVFHQFAPENTPEIEPIGMLYKSLYANYIKQQKLLSFILFIIILISCMGLFAVASFIITSRTKEIGIRKVNGSGTLTIVAMLNKDFLRWVFIAFILACPIAWYAMHKWLQNFAYKTDMSWWVFAAAGIIALAIALITVSWQSWRAATRNPVESLRYE